MEKKKIHTTNYINTFIEVAEAVDVKFYRFLISN